ncbi:MAG: hypothetical protein GXY77_11090 [Fibrobacter sp.]|nr:hypothetical protein [Fibrobacter sp.]
MKSGRKTEWTTPDDIKKLILRKWEKGVFLQDSLRHTIPYPLKFTLKHPQGQALSENFGSAIKWTKLFINTDNQPYTVQWCDINFREVGRNTLPVALLFDSELSVASFINRKKELHLFQKLTKEVLLVFPKLEDWIFNKPFVLLELAPVLKKLISITEWILKHPRPGIYLRQVSITGVDTKFIETHKKILGEWFDILLDSQHIDFSQCGIKGFEKRYGFLSKPPMIRFRILDPSLYINGLSDLALPPDQFSNLDLNADQVFISENDINGLCFPPIKGAIVLFGRGYGFEYLVDARWLYQKRIWYWGDIDTHGFAILNQFRMFFPNAKSFLMDRNTLIIHKDHWVEEKSPAYVKLENLTDDESSLYRELVTESLGKAVRLEQELISFEYFEAALRVISV